MIRSVANIKRYRIFSLVVLFLSQTLLTSLASATSYDPDSLSESIAAHDIVLVGKVQLGVPGSVRVDPLVFIKGAATALPIILPSVWQRGLFLGDIPLLEGRSYLLMINSGPAGRYELSRKFTSQAVMEVSSERDSLARAALILYELSQEADAGSRRAILRRSWNTENDETSYKLLSDFAEAPADSATIELVMNAIGAGVARSNTVAIAAIVIEKHQYRQTIPGLLRLFGQMKEDDWTYVYVIDALAKLGAKEASPLFTKTILDPNLTRHRELKYFFRALCILDDKKMAPLLIDLLNQKFYKGSSNDVVNRLMGAAAYVGAFQIEEGIEPLVKLLEDSYQSELWNNFIEALGNIGPAAKTTVPKIRAKAGSPYVSQEVVDRALRRIAGTAEPKGRGMSRERLCTDPI